MNNALPAALVGLTALVTSGLVHAGYAIWWLAQALTGGHAAFDWAGALTVSGAVSAIVLIAGLVARRLLGSDAPTPTGTAPVPDLAAVPVRVRSERP
ncbi:MAG: hypothetical protein JSS04_00645 [Proteobacteria bacterium]|nr:hypothetical protein [Pseudomonadota bacterium]